MLKGCAGKGEEEVQPAESVRSMRSMPQRRQQLLEMQRLKLRKLKDCRPISLPWLEPQRQGKQLLIIPFPLGARLKTQQKLLGKRQGRVG